MNPFVSNPKAPAAPKGRNALSPARKALGVLLGVAAGTAVCLAAETSDPVVVSGKFLEVNGQREVPRGLFGVHATPLDEQRREAWGVEMVRVIRHVPDTRPRQPGMDNLPRGLSMIIECWYDRYQPALVLTDPDGWEARLRGLAAGWAENARGVETPVVLEFWNEPYLNWASRPGVNFDGRFYSPEGREEGAPVLQRDGSPAEGLVWDRALLAADGSGNPHYLASRHIPARIDGRAPQEGDSFDFRGTRMELRTFWWTRDTQQPSFWAGPWNRELYHQMLGPLAESFREAWPEGLLIAGWDFHLHQDGWRAWEMLHRPLLDAFGDKLDGITEHHYGTDTRLVAGGYEIVDAYMKGTHGRRIQFYNTEAGGFLDPEVPSPHARPQYSANTPAEFWGTMTYTLRDILHLVAVMPDKAAARAAHAAQNSGDRYALPFLRELRGELLHVTSPDPHLWVVASYDADRGHVVVMAFHDRGRGEERSWDLEVRLPEGLTAEGWREIRPNLQEGNIGFAEVARTESVGTTVTFSLGLREAVKWIVPVSGTPERGRDSLVRREQVVYPQVHASLEPGGEFVWDVPWPETLGAEAQNGDRLPVPSFRWVQWDYSAGSAEARLGEAKIELPAYNPGGVAVAPVVGGGWTGGGGDPPRLRIQLSPETQRTLLLQALSIVWEWRE